MIEHQQFLDRIIRFALEEDLGPGDLTTEAVVNPAALGRASLIAREELVLAGLFVFKRVFAEVSPEIGFEEFFKDGELVPSGVRVCLVSGPLSQILIGERTALNFLQRMSGIATLTRQYVEKLGDSGPRVLDTRKTAPGLRYLDKYAVRAGGGFNHRFGLFDGVLIKDNHIAAAGSVAGAVKLARENSSHTVKIEVEVEDLTGVEEALKAGADTILLDNMSPKQLSEAVAIVKGRALVEASGGITLKTIEAVGKTGVDLVSVGALTHSARAADFSLEIVPEG